MKLILLMGALAALWGTMLEYRVVPEPEPTEEYVLLIDEPAPVIPEPDAVFIQLKHGGSVEELELEEYLVGVVLSEMLPAFHDEALKAQAVAARTFAARMLKNGKHVDCTLCASSSCCQAWKSGTELRKKLGSSFEISWEKAKSAVEATKGMVLTYGGNIIEAVYYSCSGGYSEPAKAVWGTDVPYLQAVESPGEEEAARYRESLRYSFGEFQAKLRSARADISIPVIPQDWVGETVRSEGGGVETMVICGESFSGPQLRSIFSLPSTLFEMTVGNGEVIFDARGYGHRVGMSQYGADAMAREGSTWQEILRHYYTDVTIEEMAEV